MLDYIMKQWKNKKLTIFLIILGFIIGNLVLSIGTSMSVETMKQSYDKNSGVPKKQLELKIKKAEDVSNSEVLKVIEEIAQFGEVQILSLDKGQLNEFQKDYQVVPVCFTKEEDWHIPMIEGRYFTRENISDEEKQIIIGKQIASENGIKNGSTILLNSEKYHVVGICGRSNRTTQWDNVIYVPWNDFVYTNETYFDTDTFFAVLKSGKKSFTEKFTEIEQSSLSKGIQLEYTSLQVDDTNTMENSIFITIIATIMVFMIAIINITNLMIYWLLERQRDLAILKALGADNQYLTICIILEIVLMAMIGAGIAVFIQGIVGILFGKLLLDNNIYCSVTYINIIIAFSVTLVCGLIAAILPARQVMRVQPADGIR